MRHDVRVSGYAYTLRPVEISDAELIIELRTQAGRSQYLHRISPDVDSQTKWIEVYLDRTEDYYFVITRSATGIPEGLVGLYDIDPAVGSAEWGRWILRSGSQAAAESALLIYRVGFEIVRLNEVYCRTVADNLSVLSFHDSCGLQRRGLYAAYGKLDDERWFDAVEHVLTRERWPVVQAVLESSAKQVAARLARSRRQ
jgi:RimJ/RimL family protein N-acetyltransferase